MERGGIVKVLLDTTVLIDILRGEQLAIEKIENIRKSSTLYISSINAYEILRGVMMLQKDRERHLNALNTLISNVYVIDFDLNAAKKASEIYSELRKKGVEIDSADYLIAGCCLSSEIEAIITRNERHFEEIKKLKVITY